MTMMEFAGLEIPRNVKGKTLDVLLKLEQDGVVIFVHDDGEDLIVAEELAYITSLCGLVMFRKTHSIVIFSTDSVNKYLFD